MKRSIVKKMVLFLVLMGSALQAQPAVSRTGRLLQRFPKVSLPSLPTISLPSLPSLPSLQSLGTPEAIQGYIARFTSIFKLLSPAALRTIITNQNAQFSRNFDAFLEAKSATARAASGAKVVGNIAAITAAAAVLAGEAAAKAVYAGGKAAGGAVIETVTEQEPMVPFEQ